MRVLVLDNYDSFTWNLVHGLEVAGASCTVWRSDATALDKIAHFAPDRIVLSPGPFGPEKTGVCKAALVAFGGTIPILGICLGLQVIAVAAGARVIPSGQPIHGKAAPVIHDGQGLFRSLPNPFQAARYHSLIVEPASVPPALVVSASAPDGTVLGLRWHGGKTEGLLFHPESFLTEHGGAIFSNFLEQ